MTQLRRLAALVFASAVAVGACAAQGSWLSAPEQIAPGVEYFTSTDQSLADPAGPTAVYLLKLDPAKVQLDSVHAKGKIMGLDTVDVIASSNKAIAAVNAGFSTRATAIRPPSSRLTVSLSAMRR